MHWIEGVIMIGAGIVPWLIAGGRFPADPAMRARLEKSMPLVLRKGLMQAMALFLWALGGTVVVGALLGLDPI